MKLTTIIIKGLCASVIAATLCCSISDSHASGKTSDPTGAPSTGGAGGGGSTSSGGTNSGGVKSKSPTSTSPAPKPAPTPILAAPLTFICTPDSTGNVPVCTGSYQIDPYYPTLSLLTLNVQASSLNMPDGSYLYVTINMVGYGYPATSNIILVANQSGTLTMSGYVTPGTTVQSVVITDASGAVVAIGQ